MASDHRMIVLGMAAACAASLAFAQDAPKHDTFVDLSSGNIELVATDGTEVLMAPQSRLAIDTSAHGGETTHVTIETGQVHVSNVFHKYNDVVQIHASEHVFRLERGTAVISFTSEGLHATMLHGRSLSVGGNDARITSPGMRLELRGGAFQETQPTPEAVRGLLDRIGASVLPGGAPSGPPDILDLDGDVLPKTLGPELGPRSGILPPLPDARRQAVQRRDVEAFIEKTVPRPPPGAIPLPPTGGLPVPPPVRPPLPPTGG